ncbi:MAG: hypothetical protein H7329_06600 [Opitutaceae bacterium]|nr:hypothetical protein [Cytophagales bacterium]
MKNYLIIMLLALICGCKSAKNTAPDQKNNISANSTPVKIEPYTGKHHSHRKQKEIESNSNYNLRQAQKIIQNNIENKGKHEKHKEDKKENMLKLLHALNFKGNKASTKRERVPYIFY